MSAPLHFKDYQAGCCCYKCMAAEIGRLRADSERLRADYLKLIDDVRGLRNEAYELGAAAERERCAKIVEAFEWYDLRGEHEYRWRSHIAAAIRKGKL